MRPLTASEAISPALERTKLLLGNPFRSRTFLKIAAVAFFADFGSSLNFNLPSNSSKFPASSPGSIAAIAAVVAVVALIGLTIGLVLFYIGSRLQLVLVEMVATAQTMVAPVWRRTGIFTWRWIGMKLLFFLAAVLLVAVCASPLIFYFVTHHDRFSSLSVSLIVTAVLIALLLLLLVIVAYTLMRDFALPFLSLEGLSISATFERVNDILAAEPGQVGLYLLLRLLLGFVIAIGMYVGVLITLLISAIPFAAVGGGLWLALHKAGTAGMAVLIVCAIAGGLAFLCWVVCLGIGAFGAMITFFQAYALYFLGGRYPLLGDLLDRSAPPPAFPYIPGYPAYPPPPEPPSGALPEAPPTL